ncbi:hypothetical protein ABVT39_012534 [Epinephelus coioides]
MEDKLIVAVCGHPELYDTTMVLYRDRSRKEQAWVKVSEEAGLPVDVCRRKWKSLRDTYLRERKKETEKRSGAAAGTGKKWRYFAVLSFLDPFVAQRETSGNIGRVKEDRTADYETECGAGPVELENEGETAAGPSGIDIGGLFTNEEAHTYSIENVFCINGAARPPNELFAATLPRPGSGSTSPPGMLPLIAGVGVVFLRKLWSTQVAFTHLSATSGWTSRARRATAERKVPPLLKPLRDGPPLLCGTAMNSPTRQSQMAETTSATILDTLETPTRKLLAMVL